MEKIYVIVTSSQIKQQEKLNSILSQIHVDYDSITHDGDEQSLISLLEEVSTIPFFTEHKVVIAKNPKYFIKSSIVNERVLSDFVNYIKNPMDSATLIFMINDLKDLEPSYKTLLEKNAIVYLENNLKEEDAKEYALNSFKKEGYQIEDSALEELLYRTKGDLERVVVEIVKLKTYKYESKKILIKDIYQLISKDLEDNVFDLVNAIVSKNKQIAIDIYNDLKVLNEDSAKIISMLVSKFNELYQTKVLMLQGFSKNDIAQIFNMKVGRVYYMIQSSKNLKLEDITSNINTLIDYDYKIKSGQIDKDLALEMFILK